ncbi:MAG: twitching motility protein PilT [Chloroflexi bacterium]|nr:twitching motility protein PilT [Candidatus Rokubacteria bacterium]MBI2324519.1 twitching motility protein PilT [Chloroflexota bacterium]MBI2983211.1 twitching motility protein PilT [Chloroflexota bacterium]
MSIVLDAGALVAVERGDRAMIALIKGERDDGRSPVTHGGVIGEVWRGGRGRQAVLARALRGVDVRALDDDLGRRAGVLLARAGSSDVIDAAVVLLAEDGDEIFTSDPADLRDLAQAASKLVDLIQV